MVAGRDGNQTALLTTIVRRLGLERAGRARERFLARFTIDRVADQMLGFYDRALVRRSARRYRRSRTRPPTPEATSQVPSTRSVAPKRYL